MEKKIRIGIIGCGGIAKGKGNKGGMATAGIVTGIIGCVIWVFYLILSFVEFGEMI